MKIKIIDLDDLGNGLTKIDNKVCFVKRGLVGEVLDIDLRKEKKSYCDANIKKIIEASSNRVVPLCKYYDQCGGCNFLHTSFEIERKFKEDKSYRFLKACHGFYKTKELRYRNKVTFHVLNGEIGYYEEKTNSLVKIDYCYLLEDKINQVLKFFLENKDSYFNGQIVIRVNYLEETLVIIDGFYRKIMKIKESSLVDNLINNDQVLKGKSYFLENILGYQFKVSYKSFFQVNRLGLEAIFKILKEFLEDKNINIALDLYSGTSVLGVLTSKYAKLVLSVEVNKLATNDAKENRRLNKINNLKVINGKVEDYIDSFKNIDLVIVDPARRGLDKKTIDYLKIIKAKYLIYIACSMDSLKRDLVFLEDIYQNKKIYLVDMFPRTNKVECVCLLNLR